MRYRCLITLANLITRRTADEKGRQRLLSYIDKGMEDTETRGFWRSLKFAVLVGVDDVEFLDQELREWIRTDDFTSPWRTALANLSAERGDIKEAIRICEQVQREDELDGDQLRFLAGWYLVENNRRAHEATRIKIFQALPEHRLNQMIHRSLGRWTRRQGEVPSELDPDVLAMFGALFNKANRPQSYLYLLRDYYRACRDFRLLQVLPHALIGQTAGKVYRFLGDMRSTLDEIRDEAVADALLDRLNEVRTRSATEVDQRALDLLEVLVRSRAAQVINQPDQQRIGALAALQRSFEREWSAGEPVQVASFLQQLGRISIRQIAEEQLSQLASLHEAAEAGSVARLQIAHHRAKALWSYGQRDDALALLEAALRPHRSTPDSHFHNAAGTYVEYLKAIRLFAKAERYALEQQEVPESRKWAEIQLDDIYLNALRHQGQVSHGKGETLYANLQRRLMARLKTKDDETRSHAVNTLCDMFDVANSQSIQRVQTDLKSFALEPFHQLVKTQDNNLDSMLRRLLRTVRQVNGPRDAMEALLFQIERQPAHLVYRGQDFWQRNTYELAKWRTEVRELGDLEPRLLSVAKVALKSDLTTRIQTNRSMFIKSSSQFWKSKEKDFVQVAEDVYTTTKTSGASVLHVAKYLYHGLRKYDRAIEILLVASQDDLLSENGKRTLVELLQERNRHGESVPVALDLVRRNPDQIRYRTLLLKGLFGSKQQEQLVAQLQAAEKHFRQPPRWNENAMQRLGRACLDCQLYDESIEFYSEVISRHERTQPNRGIGRGTLSSYYANLARAYSGIANTERAVDAAASAIIAWGSNQSNRVNAMSSLKEVIRKAKDLDDYIQSLDELAEQTQQDRPIIRKAIGQVLLERKEYNKAAGQLEIAVELQANDDETNQALMECYDELNDTEQLKKRLLHLASMKRQNFKLYHELGDRLKNSLSEQERAYTSIVESLPNESESHQLLAEIRQKQGRWEDAILHWKHVDRIRSLEPIGLIKIAEAQIHLNQWDQAKRALRKLERKEWPSRFGDVQRQVRDLDAKIEKASADE